MGSQTLSETILHPWHPAGPGDPPAKQPGGNTLVSCPQRVTAPSHPKCWGCRTLERGVTQESSPCTHLWLQVPAQCHSCGSTRLLVAAGSSATGFPRNGPGELPLARYPGEMMLPRVTLGFKSTQLQGTEWESQMVHPRGESFFLEHFLLKRTMKHLCLGAGLSVLLMLLCLPSWKVHVSPWKAQPSRLAHRFTWNNVSAAAELEWLTVAGQRLPLSHPARVSPLLSPPLSPILDAAGKLPLGSGLTSALWEIMFMVH